MSRSVSFLPSSSKSPNLIHIPEKMEVKLTDVEEQLCTLLDECRNHLIQTKGKDTSCRVAGGWVRDKVGVLLLLSSLSYDLN